MTLQTTRVTEVFIEQEDITLREGLRRFQRLDNVAVRAGIIEGHTPDYPDGTDVVMVANANHEGTKNIPSRPWLSLGFDRNLPFMAAQMEDAAENILRGRTTTGVAMALVGQQLVSMQRQSMQQLDTPPLSPRTIEAKKRNRATGRKPRPPGGYPADTVLIETQHLLDHHVFLVEGG